LLVHAVPDEIIAIWCGRAIQQKPLAMFAVCFYTHISRYPDRERPKAALGKQYQSSDIDA